MACCCFSSERSAKCSLAALRASLLFSRVSLSCEEWMFVERPCCWAWSSMSSWSCLSPSSSLTISSCWFWGRFLMASSSFLSRCWLWAAVCCFFFWLSSTSCFSLACWALSLRNFLRSWSRWVSSFFCSDSYFSWTFWSCLSIEFIWSRSFSLDSLSSVIDKLAVSACFSFSSFDFLLSCCKSSCFCWSLYFLSRDLCSESLTPLEVSECSAVDCPDSEK
mmetsp:Transcript_11029/g.16403  ORF Transcript_11029/g.16403 Transcript_11029/m.16403 type:complete len:220 (+) Transcript_11029:814-1473(+)